MYAGITEFDYECMWEQAKGIITIGGFNMSWDFTDGLSKEEWIRERRKIFEPHTFDLIVTKSGRILIPSMNIY